MFKLDFRKRNFFKFRLRSFFCFDYACGWVFILGFFFVSFLILLFGSYFFYTQIDMGEIFNSSDMVDESSLPKRIRKSELEDIIDLFELKEEERQKKDLWNGREIIDPSL